MRLAKRLAFLGFDNSFGIIKGEQPLIRASRASKVAGAFLVLFWHAKENLTSRNRALTPAPPARELTAKTLLFRQRLHQAAITKLSTHQINGKKASNFRK